MMRIIPALGGLLLLAAGAAAGKQPPVKVTSLLSNDAVLDRYAAAVAATEPLREERDRVLRENISPLKYWWMKTTKGAINVDGDTLTAQGPKSDRIRRAYTTHVVQSGRIIKSMGLSIQDFNTITRRLAQDPRLRQRVLKQAYLYRLEAKINDRLLTSTMEEEEAGAGGRFPAVPSTNSHNNDAEEKLSGSSSSGGGGGNSKFGGLFSPTPVVSNKKEQQQQQQVGGSQPMPAFAASATASAAAAAAAAAAGQGAAGAEEEGEYGGYGDGERRQRQQKGPGRVALFAQSLREIEALRAEQTRLLKREYAIDSLPDLGARPELVNLLHPKVQQICKSFPLQAGEIAARHGFEPREFDALLSKARHSALFRWRVNRLMGPTPQPAFGARGGAFECGVGGQEEEGEGKGVW